MEEQDYQVYGQQGATKGDQQNPIKGANYLQGMWSEQNTCKKNTN